MRNLKLSWAFFAIILVIASCKRDFNLPEEEATNKSNSNIEAKDLVVPAGFKFETEKTLNVNVKVADAKANERYTIKIYSDLPTTGKLISTGLTNANAEYSTSIRIPVGEEYIYIEKTSPDGSSNFEKVNANRFVNALLGSAPQSPYIIRKSGSGMNCSTCNRTVNNPSSGTLYVIDETLCLTGTISNVTVKLITGAHLNIIGNVTGGLTVEIGDGNYSTVRVCGTGTIDHLNYLVDGNVYFLEGSRMTVKNITTSTGCKLVNWSDSLIISENFFPQHNIMENNGKMYFTKTLYMETGAVFTNNGTLVAQDITLSGALNYGPSLTNNDYLRVIHDLRSDPGASITNNCHIEVNNILGNEGNLINKSYIQTGSFQQYGYSLGYTELQNGALISTNTFVQYAGKIKGTGTNRSKIKVSTITGIYNAYDSPVIEGEIDICDLDGIETNQGSLTLSAAISCAGSIPTSYCNPEGFGTSTITDSDNDGVADAQDEYPNDATRAFNSYYPNASATATIAFEDLWPAQADYDFNDLSVALNIQKVLNANNKVVECKVKMNVRAVGASFDNGFGFQLDDLVPADISSVTGQVLVRNLITRNANNTEAGQTKAVIIGFDSPEPTLHRAAGSFFNTIKTNGVGTSDTVTLNIVFAAPIDDSKLTLEKINPFMFTNRRRGYEVHLIDFKPTSLATTSLFGTFADRSNPSNNSYYKNANGMPWAILIPTDFYHPAEKKAITTAYNFFADWVISGGTTNTNWYTNTVGNQNTENIY